MSGQSVGLTRIKPQDNTAEVLQATHSHDEERTKALSIQKEILTLEGERDSLKDEIFNLVNERNHDFKQLSSEINVLRRQKIKLIDAVEAISKMLFVLQEAKDKGEVNFDDFFKGREGILVNFASAASKRIAEKSKNLDAREALLIKQENNAIELTTYAALLLDGAQRSLHEVNEAKQRLGFEARQILEQSENIKVVNQKTQDNFMESEEKVSAARKMLTKATKKMKDADKHSKEVTEKADNLLKSVQSTIIQIGAKEAFLKSWAKKLKNKDIEIGTRQKLLEKAEARSGIIKL